MKTELFDFDLPPEHIATHPVSPRDASKLLVIRKDSLEDCTVRELPELLRAGDVMVFNDTRVIPARLRGKRGEASLEITLHKYLGGKNWKAFAKPGKRIKEGDKIIFSNQYHVIVNAKYEDGSVDLEWNNSNWRECLEIYGKLPLPPYIRRQAEGFDKQTYQTVYAQKEGAVAAPTAGLHFTDELLQAIDKKGIKRVFVTLHVGAGTFQPVKSEDTDNHVMHSEYYEITGQVASTLNAARKAGNRIVAVGTTSLRVLESAADEAGHIKAMKGETAIFITPGYKFKAVDILMTNFHLPRSTLFMLVSAFSGLELMKRAYRHAILANYRFYSYGDACLLFTS